MRKSGRLICILCVALFLLGCGGSGGVRKGTTAPDFTLRNLAGEEVSLSDFAGQPVLINFWASWCPPCRTEMPELQQAYAASADGLVILAVNATYQDDLNEVQKFLDDMKQTIELTFPILLDEEGAVSVAYRVGPLPTSVFVDREGKIHLIQLGPMTQRFVESVVGEMR